MKVVILAGGLGTRLSEETEVRPKPMVEVGGRPILWHIMKHYAGQGFDEFCVALGYKGDVIKRFFVELATLRGSMTVDLSDGRSAVRRGPRGLDACTSSRPGRTRRPAGASGGCATGSPTARSCSRTATAWGRRPQRLLEFHRAHGRLATVTAVRPPSRFGGLDVREDGVVHFTEKPQMGEGWINGGFMVWSRRSSTTSRTTDELRSRHAGAARARRTSWWRTTHEGFWQPMDTLREVRFLRSLWDRGEAPWVTW